MYYLAFSLTSSYLFQYISLFCILLCYLIQVNRSGLISFALAHRTCCHLKCICMHWTWTWIVKGKKVERCTTQNSIQYTWYLCSINRTFLRFCIHRLNGKFLDFIVFFIADEPLISLFVRHPGDSVSHLSCSRAQSLAWLAALCSDLSQLKTICSVFFFYVVGFEWQHWSSIDACAKYLFLFYVW